MTRPIESATNLGQLASHLVDAIYGQEDRIRAFEIAAQIDSELEAQPDFSGSIRGDEVRSLLAELRGDLPAAIQSRQTEIRRIFELQNLMQGKPGWDYVLRQYDYRDISDRLDILATLFADEGNYEEAVRTLTDSRSFCDSHKIAFDGADLLEEYSGQIRAKKARKPESMGRFTNLDQAIIAAYRMFNIPKDTILVDDQLALRFIEQVRRLLPEEAAVVPKLVKARLLNLGKKGEARGGLPRQRRHA